MHKKINLITVILFFSIILVSGCNLKTNEKNDENSLEKKNINTICFTKKEKELSLKKIFSTTEFQTYLHPESEGRLPIQLVTNKFITPDLQISSNNQKIIFKDSLVLPYGRVHKISIDSINCNKKSFFYSVFYPIEAAIIQGKVTKNDSVWIATVTHVGEKN